MDKRFCAGVAVTLGLALGPWQAAPAAADPVADFYNGRQVSLVLSFGTGGLYGLYGHLAADHIARHILGKPNVIVQPMTGAGGVKAANYIYGAAPKDGGTIAILLKDIAVTEALRPDAVRYKSNELSWIGRLNAYIGVLVVNDQAGVTSIEEAKQKEVILASTGRSAASFLEPTLLNGLIGTKFKIVTGYPGAAQMNLAMERNEVHGWAGGGLLGFKTEGSRRDWLKAGKIRALYQTGSKRDPLIPDTPLLSELATSEDARRAIEFIDGGTHVGWALSAPPGVPADRIAALRKAFDAMMKDPAFLADVQKRNVEVDPLTGDQVRAVVAKTLGADAATVQRTRQILGF